MRSPLLVAFCAVGVVLACKECSAVRATTIPSRPSSAGIIPFVLEHVTERFTARVVSVERVKGYAYVLVEQNEGERWTRRQLVSLSTSIVVGALVDVSVFGVAEGFVSRQLGRTFERLWFVVLSPTKEHAT